MPVKPAAHERTSRAYLLFVTSWIDRVSLCASNIRDMQTKYQTCLIFGLHVTNDENGVNVVRTRENFVDPTCHE